MIDFYETRNKIMQIIGRKKLPSIDRRARRSRAEAFAALERICVDEGLSPVYLGEMD